MVNIKYALEKLFSQEEIDEREKKYEAEQFERRKERFDLQEKARIATQGIRNLGHSRIIITEIPLNETTTEVLNEVETEEVARAKEELDLLKQVKEAVNDKMEELQPGKVQCPDCKAWFAKGGAFYNHYRSHINGGE